MVSSVESRTLDRPSSSCSPGSPQTGVAMGRDSNDLVPSFDLAIEPVETVWVDLRLKQSQECRPRGLFTSGRRRSFGGILVVLTFATPTYLRSPTPFEAACSPQRGGRFVSGLLRLGYSTTRTRPTKDDNKRALRIPFDGDRASHSTLSDRHWTQSNELDEPNQTQTLDPMFAG